MTDDKLGGLKQQKYVLPRTGKLTCKIKGQVGRVPLEGFPFAPPCTLHPSFWQLLATLAFLVLSLQPSGVFGHLLMAPCLCVPFSPLIRTPVMWLEPHPHAV